MTKRAKVTLPNGAKGEKMLYKLTNENGRTHGDMQWGPGVTHAATGDSDQMLCSDGWIHAYESPLLAVLLNPIHANFRQPQLWKATGKIGKRDRQLKCGCRELTTVRRIDLPKVTTDQRIKFAILCGMVVCKDEKWNRWAKKWLSGKDRSRASAEVARAAEAAWASAEAANINLIFLSEEAMK
jgi:hypothetical protein